MLKFVFKVILSLIVIAASVTFLPSLHAYQHLLMGPCVVFGLPQMYARWKAGMQEARWKRDSELARADRANAEEHAHQTALRRERERMEMHAEMRVKELIATLEVQFRIDARKMEQLAQMKAEFASRQQADMASLLGRLEAMKAEA